MVLNEKLLKIADIRMSLQAASRSFMKMGSNSFNTQLLLATRTFCAAPPIAERIQVLTLFNLHRYHAFQLGRGCGTRYSQNAGIA